MTPGNVSFHKIRIHELDGSTKQAPPITQLANFAPINRPNAWFVSCDYNGYIYADGSDITRALPYWAFEWNDAAGFHQTKFSETLREVTLSGEYFTLSKGQTEALSNGVWINTPNAITASQNILDSPSAESTLKPLTDCPATVQAQFGSFL